MSLSDVVFNDPRDRIERVTEFIIFSIKTVRVDTGIPLLGTINIDLQERMSDIKREINAIPDATIQKIDAYIKSIYK